MHWIDWLLLAVPFAAICIIAIFTRRYVQGVADFLAAGRVAGRYLVANAESTANVGAISIIAMFEMMYLAGTTVGWWQSLKTPLWILITGSGYIAYRYRETRALTMAQFFEMRYSRRFRIFMGALAWISGLLNFGLFPVISAKFFVTFLSLPVVVHPLGGVAVPTYIVFMTSLIGAEVFFITLGGQLTAMVTDCIEGLISGVMLVALMIGVCYVFSWHQMATALTSQPAGQSFINPFDAAKIPDFNIWYVITGLFTGVYGYMAWQGNSGFNASALNPQEAKMGKVLGQWRAYARASAITLLALGALTYMHHPEFAGGAAKVNAEISANSPHPDSRQMRPSAAVVPVAIRDFLPIGMRGMLAAVMLFAALACDASYMHSWGSIFVQDVLLPIRQSRGHPPLSPHEHLRWLRISILGVAIFAFLFGIVYRESVYLLMYFAVTGAIFLGGAGSCIVGGLYWRRGTTAGAWSGMIVGSTLAVGGMIAQGILPHFPLNGQWICCIAMLAGIFVYTTVSIATCRIPHDMDKLLNRGRFAVDPVTGEPLPQAPRAKRNWRSWVGIDGVSSTGDIVQCALLFAWSFGWFAVFTIVTIWNLIHPWPTSWWVTWTFATGIVLAFIVSILTTIWFTWGGIRDLSRLFARLRTLRTNRFDDGTVSEIPDADHETPGGRPVEDSTVPEITNPHPVRVSLDARP